jgi:hypothetical protein
MFPLLPSLFLGSILVMAARRKTTSATPAIRRIVVDVSILPKIVATKAPKREISSLFSLARREHMPKTATVLHTILRAPRTEKPIHEVMPKNLPWFMRAVRKIVGPKSPEDDGRIAVTIGHTIYYFIDPSEKLRRHEREHVLQAERVGTARFWASYFAESFKRGYWNNKYEVAARHAETAVRS